MSPPRPYRDSPADQGILALIDAPAFGVRGLLPLLVGLVLPARVLGALPSSVGQALTWSGGDSASGFDLTFLLAMALTYGGIFVSSITLAAMYAGLTWAVLERSTGRQPTALDAWRFGLRPPVLLTSLLLAVLGGLGAAMCLLPGVAVAAWMGTTLPVLAAEGLSGGKAMDRAMVLSRHGRRGRWFTSTAALSACVVMTWWMINSAVGSLVALPAGVIGAIIGVRAATEGGQFDPGAVFHPALALVINLGGAIFYGLSDLYLAGGLVLVYRRARDLTEGADLTEMLAAGADAPREEGATSP